MADVETDPARWRFFTEGETTAPHVCILGHDAWDTLFDGSGPWKEIALKLASTPSLRLRQGKAAFGSGKTQRQLHPLPHEAF